MSVLNGENLAQVMLIINTVHFGDDSNSMLYTIIRKEAKPMVPYIECVLGTRNYKTLLKRRVWLKK